MHGASSYNFLRGASNPEDMVAAARRRGIGALALLDRDGLYGAIEFAEAARGSGVATVFGAELGLPGGVLPVLCKGPEGYRLLSTAITRARMAGDKDISRYPELAELAAHAAGHWYVLAGREWLAGMNELVAAFGGDVLVEYAVSMTPEDADVFADLEEAQARHGLRGVATTRACAATRAHARLAGAKQALCQRMSLDEAQPQLHPAGAMWLRGAEDLRALFGHRSHLVDEAWEVAQECAFDLDLVAPELPRWEVPEGHSEQSWLAHLVAQRFEQRYAGRSPDIAARAKKQIEHELGVIEQLGFPGYFLIVEDLVAFSQRSGILCQGRGSAANSVVCFTLGITNAEPISAGLLFERFLSPEREGAPDIDLDIESGRREEVIQYVYEKYGRDNAAQVANVITYRRRGAVRDAARALGYSQGAADGWARGAGEPPADVLELAEEFIGQPRHLGIHSGGMVICDRPIAEVVPVEWARMENRSVVQWDKESCASAGLVKFDLLGLGMLEALHHMIDLVAETTGVQVNLWELDLSEPGVYEMLSRGDAVGVFQVESRAQLNTLPRMQPRCFFDLVVEVALIRPGPIQGGSVHPYLRRRDGREPVSYEHPVLEKALGKTLGVPLFQEQLMQIAVDAAGFTGGEADDLRRAMGSKRSPARMAALKKRFYSGLAETSQITGHTADALWNKVVAFAAYGFPESHSQSFASIVFFSAWFKLHYPAEFCVGLLRAQPMGFYSPQSLLADARRHGVTVLPVCVNNSGAQASVEDGAIRLGLDAVKGLGRVDEIVMGAPFRDVADLSRRAELSVGHIEALARAGALEVLGVGRREALWQAGMAATEKPGMLELGVISAPALPGMSAFEVLVMDIAATGITHDRHPMALLRDRCAREGIVASNELHSLIDGQRVRLAGVVTHRQRPRTASGVTFLSLEDEHGLINVVVSPGAWARYRKVARTAKALVVRGILRNASGVCQIEADKLEELPVEPWLREGMSPGSRDFR